MELSTEIAVSILLATFITLVVRLLELFSHHSRFSSHPRVVVRYIFASSFEYDGEIKNTMGLYFSLFPVRDMHICDASHDMEHHAAHLQHLCRVGGAKFTACSQQTRYPVSDYTETMKNVFSIDVCNDDPTIHPTYICALCQRVLKRSQSTEKFNPSGGGCGQGVTFS